MGFFTADLCDEYDDKIEILSSKFKSFGGTKKFRGQAITVKLDKNNKDLISLLKDEDGSGKVVVVDVEEKYYAVVGENLMKLANNSRFEGIIVNGYVRDVVETKEFEVGLLAIGTCPRKYIPIQDAKINVPVCIDGVTINKDDYIYVDQDGIVVSKKSLI
ncbi:MAG: ribonuclease E activity regulator RraA [Campylobacterota bacterium]